jgi:hypothetical protein
LDEYDDYIAMDGAVHAIESEIWAQLTNHFRFGPFTRWDQPLKCSQPGVGRTGQSANRDLLAPTLPP